MDYEYISQSEQKRFIESEFAVNAAKRTLREAEIEHYRMWSSIVDRHFHIARELWDENKSLSAIIAAQAYLIEALERYEAFMDKHSSIEVGVSPEDTLEIDEAIDSARARLQEVQDA